MPRALLIIFTLALFASTAQAQTITPGPWTLYKGTSIVQPRVDHPTDAACIEAARQMPLGTYTCRGSTKVVNVQTLPAPALGSLELRVRATTEQPVAADIGAFRTTCKPSHYLKDDPIVYPGKPGASHLHTFFGNTSVNANTASLTEGASTCLGGVANRSAYWIPTMLDAGKVVQPHIALIYYKRGYALARDTVISTLPAGLRMVASRGWHECLFKDLGHGNGTRGAQIPACPVGNEVWSATTFPQCWNGKDLDSADHRSHMAYPSQGKCPATHPVALPEIMLIAIHQSNGASERWRLASDANGQANGASLHADWWNGWSQDVSDAWVKNCVQANKDCHAHLLGDGRALY